MIIEGEITIRRPRPSPADPETMELVDLTICIDGQIVVCSAGKFVTEVKGWDNEGREVDLTHRERVLGFAILTQQLKQQESGR